MARKALAASTCLLLAISTSWVGVAQLARAAEVDSEGLQHRSVVPLLTWANATAWILLALPHMARRIRDKEDEKKQPAVIPGLAEQRGGVPGSTPRVDASTPPGLIAHVHFEDQMNVDVQMGSRPRATSLILFCKF